MSKPAKREMIEVTAKHVVYQGLDRSVDEICRLLKIRREHIPSWDEDEMSRAMKKITRVLARHI